MDTRSAHAFARFGLGRLGAEPAPSDPAAWLLGQLTQPDPVVMDPPATTIGGLIAAREDHRTRNSRVGKAQGPALYRAQGNASLAHAMTTRAPFRERLVWFWTNHFTISVRRGQCAPVAAAYVEEAIRPHVTGRFEDMLLAVMRHPAMLIYLDNINSMGPNSRVGRNGRGGLNENLARECLELHTVSPASGYTQADVTSFARILTGWRVNYEGESPGFIFDNARHEPGEHAVLGKTFPAGEAGGQAALRFLAAHPSTHRFLATKLARHFVADEPPERAIRQIEGALRDSKGDLGVATRALVGMEDAWRQPGAKWRTPQELVVAGFRALDLPPETGSHIIYLAASLGQPLWRAPAPDGWSDVAADWATPEAIMLRIDWGYGFAGRIGQRNPMTIAENALGPMLRPATRDAMAHAGSRRDAMTLLLTSPEFQRR